MDWMTLFFSFNNMFHFLQVKNSKSVWPACASFVFKYIAIPDVATFLQKNKVKKTVKHYNINIQLNRSPINDYYTVELKIYKIVTSKGMWSKPK